MEKHNYWEGFKFPGGCALDAQGKVKRIEAANNGKRNPFFCCTQSQWIKCPSRVHLECYIQALRKRDQKTEK
ncbi:hypothetical protein D4R51_00825 [bacterium]|nr:MAG: hypothetical protein D4R51_00825 [bacterium]